MVGEVRDAADHAGEFDLADLAGRSQSFQPAVRLAAERPARALILEAPFTSINDVASEHAPMFASSSSMITDSFASRDWIGRVTMPVLIIHGDRDSVVPFDEGEHLYELANGPKQFVRMPGGDHATLVRDGEYDHIWPFLAEHPRT